MRGLRNILFLGIAATCVVVLFQSLKTDPTPDHLSFDTKYCEEIPELLTSEFDTTALINQVVTEAHETHKDDFLDSLSRKKRLWGIDISKYQRNINWSLMVRKNKPDFVFVKATEGITIRDRMYKNHKRNLEKHNILHGAYHFWSFTTNGTTQAKRFIRFAKLKKGNLAPVVDIEYGRRRLPSKRRIVRELKRFCKVIEEEYGVKPIIYTQPHLYNKYLKKDFKGYAFWFADYRRQPRGRWAIWQHTSRARIYGYRGRIDRNIMRNDKAILKQLVML